MRSAPRMQELFAAARDDAPSDVVRDQVWGRVVATTTVVPAGAAAANAVATPAASKLIAVGALLGGVSVAVAVLAFSAMTERASATEPPRRAPTMLASGPKGGARLAPVPPRKRATRETPAVRFMPSSASSVRSGMHDEASALAEEARLVTDARAALIHGEPERALSLTRSTYGLAARALEPEELGLEARALRALARFDEALAIELTLRRRFPGHALSR